LYSSGNLTFSPSFQIDDAPQAFVKPLSFDALLMDRKKTAYLCCKQCGQEVGHKRDIFSVYPDHGPSYLLINQAGREHIVITLRKTTGLYLIDEPNDRDHAW